MTVRLFGHWTCPYVNRVAFALAQRRIGYSLLDVPPSAVRPKDFELPEEFIAHSPRLEVPLICVDGEFLADSIPILHFLEAQVDGRSLCPTGSGAVVSERVHALDAQMMPAMAGVSYGTDPERVTRASVRLTEALDQMDAWLEDAEWLAGPEPTLAEAIAVPLYLRLDGLGSLGFTGPVPPAVADHRTRTMGTDGGRHVTWTKAQASEYVDRHLAYRSRH